MGVREIIEAHIPHFLVYDYDRVFHGVQIRLRFGECVVTAQVFDDSEELRFALARMTATLLDIMSPAYRALWEALIGRRIGVTRWRFVPPSVMNQEYLMVPQELDRLPMYDPQETDGMMVRSRPVMMELHTVAIREGDELTHQRFCYNENTNTLTMVGTHTVDDQIGRPTPPPEPARPPAPTEPDRYGVYYFTPRNRKD